MPRSPQDSLARARVVRRLARLAFGLVLGGALLSHAIWEQLSPALRIGVAFLLMVSPLLLTWPDEALADAECKASRDRD